MCVETWYEVRYLFYSSSIFISMSSFDRIVCAEGSTYKTPMDLWRSDTVCTLLQSAYAIDFRDVISDGIALPGFALFLKHPDQAVGWVLQNLPVEVSMLVV